MVLDVQEIRRDFPILSRKMNGKKLAYLDNAATTQKPKQVVDAIADYYKSCNANVHRGAYRLSEESTLAYEQARARIASFIGAAPEEIIFTRNTTESLNVVAQLVCKSAGKGSVLLTQMEHHSNIVPWQINAKENRMGLDYAPIMQDGALDYGQTASKLREHPVIFSFSHASNVLGEVNDAKKLCRLAKESGAYSCVDAAQTVPHIGIDVRKMGCNFLAFSGHKMCGPMGIGVLYMKKELQEMLPPLFGGGDMIKSVRFDRSEFAAPPQKFEAGTPNVAGAVGLAAAVNYLKCIGMKKIEAHSNLLTRICEEELSSVPGIRFHRLGRKEVGLLSFNIGKIHAHDAGEFANQDGIAIRAGHHCAQPLMGLLGEAATCRASFYLYNTEEEVGRLVSSMKRCARRLG